MSTAPPKTAPKAPPKAPSRSSTAGAKPTADVPAFTRLTPTFRPPCIVVNAVEGWGKTTLGAYAPEPAIIMAPIPLTLIGIAPGHLIFGAFFTATSMIGMIALAGIMVRNGILLIDYLEARLSAGVPMKQAIIEAGAVRTRPIALTAGTVVIGAVVILFDPIFQGLAVALIMGALVSTVLTLIVVPGIYYLMRRSGAEAPVVVPVAVGASVKMEPESDADAQSGSAQTS